MSMNDPIADMLTRIRNALSAEKVTVDMPSAKQKIAIAELLKQEGFINDYSVNDAGAKPVLTIDLKYYAGKPVIEMIKRVSSPGLRIYKSKDDLPQGRDRQRRRRFPADCDWSAPSPRPWQFGGVG